VVLTTRPPCFATSASDGSLRAVEVVVFPDSLRGFAEGHYPWDLGSKSMMTNATIADKVQSVEGETVNVTYKGGEKKITIPANIPIVGLVPSEHSEIKPGAIVFVPTAVCAISPQI
jgi:hypothetical protein